MATIQTYTRGLIVSDQQIETATVARAMRNASMSNGRMRPLVAADFYALAESYGADARRFVVHARTCTPEHDRNVMACVRTYARIACHAAQLALDSDARSKAVR